MEPSDLLAYVVRAMDGMGLSYFVTGSTATIFYGEPRLTNDIDVVAFIRSDRIDVFCSRFPPTEFYVSREAAMEAVSRFGQFNVIHPSSGLKVDVMIPEDTAFNRSRLSRVVRVRTGDDLEVPFASPEDVILKKLEYYKRGGSEKHLRDIAGVLKISGPRIDHAYVEKWAAELGVIEIWHAVGRSVDH